MNSEKNMNVIMRAVMRDIKKNKHEDTTVLEEFIIFMAHRNNGIWLSQRFSVGTLDRILTRAKKLDLNGTQTMNIAKAVDILKHRDHQYKSPTEKRSIITRLKTKVLG